MTGAEPLALLAPLAACCCVPARNAGGAGRGRHTAPLSFLAAPPLCSSSRSVSDRPSRGSLVPLTDVTFHFDGCGRRFRILWTVRWFQVLQVLDDVIGGRGRCRKAPLRRDKTRGESPLGSLFAQCRVFRSVLTGFGNLPNPTLPAPSCGLAYCGEPGGERQSHEALRNTHRGVLHLHRQLHRPRPHAKLRTLGCCSVVAHRSIGC